MARPPMHPKSLPVPPAPAASSQTSGMFEPHARNSYIQGCWRWGAERGCAEARSPPESTGINKGLQQLGKDPICASFTPLFAPAMFYNGAAWSQSILSAKGCILLITTQYWRVIKAPAPLISFPLRFHEGFCKLEVGQELVSKSLNEVPGFTAVFAPS